MDRGLIRRLLSQFQPGMARDNSGVSWALVRGGRNNRVFKVAVADGFFCLKCFHGSGRGARSRLDAEVDFLTHARESGLGTVPQPLAVDRKASALLMTWLDGQPWLDGHDWDWAMDHCLEFLVQLNRRRTARMNPAADACLCPADHLADGGNRLRRLADLDCRDDLDHGARTLIRDELLPRWEAMAEKTGREFKDRGWDLHRPLPRGQRIISPSDFGFHNVCVREAGLGFFDFEYSGWDDPVKLICDFFSQPDHPPPMDYLSAFVRGLGEGIHGLDSNELEWTVRRFLPLYQIKWTCIILNEFLGEKAEQRRFALGRKDQRAPQLEKARAHAHRHRF
ncbi:MAG: aminoglycoside phosphotransferase family protein [Desulfobacterales bacterium]|nr:aminoglycoside phosphotransferase family protein [Desulfobacterales bacterium]